MPPYGPLPRPTPPPVATRLVPLLLIQAVAALVAVMSVFLPWIKVSISGFGNLAGFGDMEDYQRLGDFFSGITAYSDTANGMASGYSYAGVLVLFLGIAVVLACLLKLGRALSISSPVLLGLSGPLLLISLIAWIDVLGDAGQTGYGLEMSTGLGIWLVLLASMISAGAGVWLAVVDRAGPAPYPAPQAFGVPAPPAPYGPPPQQ